MKPVTAAIAAALISGVAMYTVGARTANLDAFTQPSTQALDLTRPMPPASYASPATVITPRAVPRRTVYRAYAPVAPTSERVVYQEARPQRSWTKTAMIIGGSAAGGAGLGGIVDGSKGALIGAALGGGAASIYEASHR